MAHTEVIEEGGVKTIRKYFKECQLFQYQRFENGKLHSINGKPSNVKYYSNDNLKLEEWHNNGILHRENDYSNASYYENGQLHIKEWRNTGKVIKREEFRKDGERGRLNI